MTAENEKTQTRVGEVVQSVEVASRMRLIEKAAKRDWPVDDAVRLELLELALHIARTSTKPGRQLAAVRAVVAMDAQNVRREANDAGERNADKAAAAALLGDAYRAAMSSADTLELMLQLDKKLAHAPAAASTVPGGTVEPEPTEPTHPNQPCGDAECWCARVTGWTVEPK